MVDKKSRAESTKDATREMEEEESTARPFEMRRMKLMAKLTDGTEGVVLKCQDGRR